jgi:hypothetical protein
MEKLGFAFESVGTYQGVDVVFHALSRAAFDARAGAVPRPRELP